jgi:CHAD domain-containing protein
MPLAQPSRDAAVEPTVSLQLSLPPDTLPALRRRLALRFGRPHLFSLAWHDGEDGALARAGRTVTAWREGQRHGWRLDPLVATAEHPLLLAQPPTPLAEAATPAALFAPAPPPVLVPVLHLDARRRNAAPGPDEVAASLVEGTLGTDGGAAIGAPALARLTLSGPAPAVATRARLLAETLGATPATHPLAGEARLLAAMPVPARPLGPAIPAPGAEPGAILAHAVSHLLAVVLHHAPRAAAGAHGEPVHQMRVALRRLRSIAALFRPVTGCPEVEALRDGAKALATMLGPARDWDVFLAGAGPATAAAFPDEPGLAPLLAAAEDRRAAAYADLAAWLAGPGLAHLAIDAALLSQSRPWPAAGVPTDTFETAILDRQRRRVVGRKHNPAGQPDAALHALRLRAKRLRYAAELFAPLHPGRPARRFLRRLAALQEELGLLNDGVVADALMHDLAGAGGTALPGGLVRGFVAGRADGARARIVRAWKRLRRCSPFWLANRS